jgi:hypothetical protein
MAPFCSTISRHSEAAAELACITRQAVCQENVHMLGIHQQGHDPHQHLILVLEIVVKSAFRNIRRFGNIFCRGAVEALLSEQAGSSFQDQGPASSDAPFPARTWRVNIHKPILCGQTDIEFSLIY